ncbi:carbohydrate diacid regulator [Clostridium acetobutylicum]|uniref:CdaR family transcriptional regulator n=1 Tax=Clostridium TaxID=1485 RepID=UPI000200C869|nr:MULTISPECIES: CdaR family transcriptional regulator [Clostridium]ADZ21878.1 Conserved hypothetical protein [Clostridium acetobutylicum EA 2018]AEI32579.1 hypothetical protein SMB_G2869 [Clostridium acetobutylicum DSM 1731]AWV78810.1 transcriptional regulator [Clostridium acetobutylicum]KHD37138.1 transcriptional regulator [Clostridium acetobutylicum]MBC2393675.1 transcriptional regulator [Clostridium acetobutylicum]
MRLSKTIAQSIVEEMMNVIPYNINVMNEEGIIIGSGDLSRIGNLHEGALEAIKEKSLNVIYSEKNSVKPGVNEPIIIDGKVIGVIGITGYSDEVKKFIKLVRVTAVLLIEQAEANEESQNRNLKRERFYYDLINRKTPYDEKFSKIAQDFGFDISKKHRAILVYGNNTSKKFYDLKKKYIFNYDLDINKTAFFISDDYKYKLLIDELKHYKDIEKIGIGEKEDIAAISLENSKKGVELGKKIKPNSKIYEYEELKFFIHLHHKNKEEIVNLISSIDKSEYKLELIQTIQIYVEENGQINDAALRLNIHRNTLNYRLERIKKITGKDPKNFFQLFELFCGLIWRE